MKNIQAWQPTKIVATGRSGRRLRVNPSGLAPGSLFITLAAFEALDACAEQLGGHLVDLGCGEVPYYPWYRDRVERITCVDWAGSDHQGLHVDVQADLNQHVPLPDGSADCVLLSSVLEHIREPGHLLREIARILRPGGRLILSVPFLYHLHEEPHDFHRYTEHSLRHLARQAGLEIRLLSPYGGPGGVLVDVASKLVETSLARLNHRPRLRAVHRAGTAMLRAGQELAFRLMRRRRPSVLSRRMPLGYVMVLARPATG